jgi:signal peptidase II
MTHPSPTSRRLRWFVLAFVLVATIGCDRVTKHVATTNLADAPEASFLADTVRLQYVENTGGFLSLGADWSPAVRTGLFTVVTGLLLLVLTAVALRPAQRMSRALGLTASVAGGASNWIDRVVNGSVVDFLNVGVGPIRTGIFNVADVAIMAGVAILLFTELRPPAPEPPEGAAPQ